MTTINDITDLVRILRTDPDWADAVRSVLLSQELKKLPEEFAALIKTVRDNTETVNRRLEILEAGQEPLQAKADNMETKIDALDTKIDALDMKVGTLETKVDRMDTSLNAVRGELGNLSGSFCQKDASRFANRLARRRFNLRETSIIHTVGQAGESRLTELLDVATLDPLLEFSEEDAALLELTDTVVVGRDSGHSEVYLLADTSITIYADDVSGAKTEHPIGRISSRYRQVGKVPLASQHKRPRRPTITR